jgi:hypothetical protein
MFHNLTAALGAHGWPGHMSLWRRRSIYPVPFLSLSGYNWQTVIESGTLAFAAALFVLALLLHGATQLGFWKMLMWSAACLTVVFTVLPFNGVDSSRDRSFYLACFLLASYACCGAVMGFAFLYPLRSKLIRGLTSVFVFLTPAIPVALALVYYFTKMHPGAGEAQELLWKCICGGMLLSFVLLPLSQGLLNRARAMPL